MSAGQSKRGSFLESLSNVAIGYSVALVAQLLIFPLFAIHVSFAQNAQIGALFTLVSIARSYVVRRLFNAITVRLERRRLEGAG